MNTGIKIASPLGLILGTLILLPPILMRLQTPSAPPLPGNVANAQARLKGLELQDAELACREHSLAQERTAQIDEARDALMHRRLSAQMHAQAKSYFTNLMAEKSWDCETALARMQIEAPLFNQYYSDDAVKAEEGGDARALLCALHAAGRADSDPRFAALSAFGSNLLRQFNDCAKMNPQAGDLWQAANDRRKIQAEEKPLRAMIDPYQQKQFIAGF